MKNTTFHAQYLKSLKKFNFATLFPDIIVLAQQIIQFFNNCKCKVLPIIYPQYFSVFVKLAALYLVLK